MESSQPQIRLALLGLLALCLPASPLPTGAPISACTTMHPKHQNITHQESMTPYTIEFSKTSSPALQVKIAGGIYKGILLQAREPGAAIAIGTWSTSSPDTKTLACFNRGNSAITHSNINDKNGNVIYSWTPPANCVSKMTFVATIAESKAVYWVKILSEEISITCDAVKCMSGFAVLAAFMVWSLTVF
uniref:putative defense protein 3 n=1 Tax=Pristiophorus japonicus TaxID=55135 RepID=UPI00398F0CE7